jgi:hypothetical protein
MVGPGPRWLQLPNDLVHKRMSRRHSIADPAPGCKTRDASLESSMVR